MTSNNGDTPWKDGHYKVCVKVKKRTLVEGSEIINDFNFLGFMIGILYPDVQAEGLSDAVEIDGRNVKVPE